MPDLSGQHLAALRSVIVDKPPYSSGVCTIASDHFQLFYRSNGKDARCIDLSTATEDEVKDLAQTCTPATFGRNNEDVFDESYRKAWKLDRSNFATNFYPLDHEAVVGALRSEILEGYDEKKPIRAELYKLNIYGPGSFFKAHKDTPRAENMFGSLVVVYPTPHVGGALILRHRGQEWKFDSGEILASHAEPRLAYAAFYGDVEHEVTPVESGYRVTLTYNLYFSSPEDTAEPEGPAVSASNALHKSKFREMLQRLLDDPTFLPDGGSLGFGLRYQYPVEQGKDEYTDMPVKSVTVAQRCLKGSDAVIWTVCRDLSLHASIKVLYIPKDDEDECNPVVMKNNFERVCTWDGAEESLHYLLLKNGARIVQSRHNEEDDATKDFDEEYYERFRREKVYWVTDWSEYNKFSDPYLAYGNESSLAFAYGNLCLIVGIGPYGERSKVSTTVKKNKGEVSAGPWGKAKRLWMG